LHRYIPGNPKFGRQSFDNFGSTLLTMFTCITLVGAVQVESSRPIA
jgi:hypothetical protein